MLDKNEYKLSISGTEVDFPLMKSSINVSILEGLTL